MAHEYRPHRWVDRRRGRGIGDFEIYDFVLQPFFEPSNAFGQVSSCLELRIRDRENGDLGQCMLEERLQVARERLERLVSALGFC
jgi:hypothetical protein